MALFSALRDDYHNCNYNQSRKSRRGRGHSRRSRAQTFSLIELLEARQLLSGATIYVDVNSTSTEAGTQANPYHHIQEAINASQAGDTLSIAPGTYAEALDITHPLQLLGPNAGINPNTGSRTAEAVIIPPVNNPDAGIDFLVQANNVTIDGLTIDGHNDALSGGTVFNGIAVNAASGITNVDRFGNDTSISGLQVQNNIIRNFTKFGVIGELDDVHTSTGNAIRNNNIDNVPFVDSTPFPSNQGRGISIEDGFFADVTGNVITRCATGIQANAFVTPSGAAPSTLSDNTIRAYDRGILLHTLDTDTPAFVVVRNTISAESGPYTTTTNAGLEIAWALGSTTVTATDNAITGTRVGVKLSYDTTPNLTVSGGRLSGNDIGVLLTNANPANSVPKAVLGNLAGVVVQDCSAAGLEVDDALASGAPATLSVDAETAVTGSPHGVILKGPNARLREAGPPTISFTTTPPSLSNSSDATFAYTVSNTVSTPGDLVARYSLDGRDVAPTSNPVTLSQLSDGPHTFAVMVTDQAGESGTTTYQWTVQASNVGPVSVAAQSGTLTYGTAGDATFTVTVNRGTGTGSFDADLSIISTLPSGASASFIPTSVHFGGSDSSRTATLTISTSATSPAGVTSFTVKAVNHADANDSATGSSTLTVNRADATIAVTPYSVTYDGKAHTATGTATGVNNEDLSSLLTLSGTTHTGAGTYAGDAWGFAGNGNYNSASGAVDDRIAKADATIAVTPYSVTYDGKAHTATGTATGVNNEDLSSLLTLSGTTHTGAGTYAGDAWGFAGNGNYNSASGAVDDRIAKADATIVVQGYFGTYDGQAHSPSGTATGVNGENLSNLLHFNAAFTDAGTYTVAWSFDGNDRYQAARGETTVTITKANANVVVNGFIGTYDGLYHSASGYATGVNGENLSGLLNLGPAYANVGVYAAAWSFAGNRNYNATAGTAGVVISPVELSTVVTTQPTIRIPYASSATLTITVTSLSQLRAGATVYSLLNGAPLTISVNGTGFSTLAVAKVAGKRVTLKVALTPGMKNALGQHLAKKGSRTQNVFTVSGKLNGGNYSFSNQAATRLTSCPGFLRQILRFGR